MVCMCSVDGLTSRQFVTFGLVHCFVCVLLTVCHVSVLRTVLHVVCLIVWYVSVSCTVLNVFCKIVCYVSVLRTVVFLQDFFALVFCTLFWMGSVRSFITLVPQEVFYICFVDGLLPSGVAHCFWCVLLTFCYASVLRTVWYAFSWQFVTLVSCALFYMFFVDCLSR